MDAAAVSPELLQQIGDAIRSMRYGTVQVTVHNARVVQIDKIERVRFTPATDLTRGPQASTPPIPDRTSGGRRSDGR
jgi:hypothetical protein